MKIFGWKSAGRDDSRPALSRYDSRYAGVGLGAFPASYEAQLREGYLGNAIAQRAVRLVAQGLGGAPLTASDPAILALLKARSGGQVLAETVAAQLLLHGIRGSGSIASVWSRSRCAPAGIRVRCPTLTRCAVAIRRASRR